VPGSWGAGGLGLLLRRLSQLHRRTQHGINGAVIVATAIALSLLAVASPQSQVVTDPEIRGLVLVGPVRVLVTLQVGSSDGQQREDTITRAQDRVLSRLPPAHASLVRRFTSIPMLALEIDATALGILESLTDLVASVQLDRKLSPQ
jgi:hypothetical protein